MEVLIAASVLILAMELARPAATPSGPDEQHETEHEQQMVEPREDVRHAEAAVVRRDRERPRPRGDDQLGLGGPDDPLYDAPVGERDPHEGIRSGAGEAVHRDPLPYPAAFAAVDRPSYRDGADLFRRDGRPRDPAGWR